MTLYGKLSILKRLLNFLHPLYLIEDIKYFSRNRRYRRLGENRFIQKILKDPSLNKLPKIFNGQTISVDIGCGKQVRNPFRCDLVFGYDLVTNDIPGITKSDLLTDGIPLESGSVSVLTAFDFLEHIPRVVNLGGTKFPFVYLVSEVYRVLAEGGLFYSKTPAFPAIDAFTDPTHVNIITEDTFPYYFCSDHEVPRAHIYGFIGDFKLVGQIWDGPWLITCLRK